MKQGGRRRRFGWLEAGFLGVLAVALVLRLWELDGRAMHYDEAIHVSYAWRLSLGEQYLHAPWMHGPFQIELTALMFRLFGDTEFTARLGYALFGTALVGLPYFLREYLGRPGALLAAVLLALSPVMLYFSRFGREDIPLVFWTTALLVLMWRYVGEGKHRYLYLGSAVLAFLFATKETAYIVAAIFMAMTFLTALRDLVPWALRRGSLRDLVGPAGFLLFLATLTLPQWAAASGLLQSVLGLRLVTPEGVPNALVGAPHWAAPFVALPVYDFPPWLHGLVVVAMVGGVVGVGVPLWGRASKVTGGLLAAHVGVPLGLVAATSLAIFRPIGGALPTGVSGLSVDLPVAGAIAVAAIGCLAAQRHSWTHGTLLVAVPVVLTALYAALFTQAVNLSGLMNSLLPSGVRVDTSRGIPVNYLFAGGVLAIAFAVSIWLGVRWRGGVWLACAAIFYGIWLTMYTTFYNNWAGFFSGVWQGMGYWIAQQDVARGGQPWYYYFVSMSVYEFLPLIFGVAGTIYYLRKREVFGLALAFWVAATFLAYTVATEKMPWLTVNVALPFIFLAGKFLGELAEGVPWRAVFGRGQWVLMVLTPLAVVEGAYVLYRFVDPLAGMTSVDWAVLAGAALLAVAAAYLIRLATPRVGLALAGLGIASLLLVLSTLVGIRAIYTYDDSIKEILVYAQGSADLQETFQGLERDVFRSGAQRGAVEVDYDLWYPFNWYVRHQQREGKLRFVCYKEKGEPNWNDGCSRVPSAPEAPALLVATSHAGGDLGGGEKYQRQGPYRNLLWFPESYRRKGENRKAEGVRKQLKEDLKFFKEVATRRDSWKGSLDYLIFRRLKHEWFDSKYHSFLPRENTAVPRGS